MQPRTGNPLRCGCSRQPLLAYYGVDEKGKPYLHVKAYKGRRIFVEIVTTSGDISIKCRECFRWYTVVIPTDGKQAHLKETDPPAVSDDEPIVGHA